MKKSRGRPPRAKPATQISVKVSDDVLRDAKRVVAFTPNSLTGMVEKGLVLAVEKELAEYRERYGHDMPSGDQEEE